MSFAGLFFIAVLANLAIDILANYAYSIVGERGGKMLIKPASALIEDYDGFSQLAHAVNEPVFLTKEGEGDLVLMSIQYYEAHFVNAGRPAVPAAAAGTGRPGKGDSVMTEGLLGLVLKELYQRAPRGLQVAGIHVFAIHYAEAIESGRLNKKEILRVAGLPESYQTELSKGVNLARYVCVKEDMARQIHQIQSSLEPIG
ncbi:hypothetical protein KQI82_02945 [Oscillibacter sp. MSJ-2]|uniref:HTH-like domain-containing protein n=1 Tax=Dysosmobacter acutus TaxID=2841504 RepID=A0ABS6F6H3_9FIRM|nr:hypothetical protein [Dysosmobacter acutus]MBU5625894.1 hypothetical protein [Dysosmobacter acutus]